MSDRNVAQAAYALSRLVHSAGMPHPARTVAATALTTERTTNVDVFSGQPQCFGGLSRYLRPLGCAFGSAAGWRHWPA